MSYDTALLYIDMYTRHKTIYNVTKLKNNYPWLTWINNMSVGWGSNNTLLKSFWVFCLFVLVMGTTSGYPPQQTKSKIIEKALQSIWCISLQCFDKLGFFLTANKSKIRINFVEMKRRWFFFWVPCFRRNGVLSSEKGLFGLNFNSFWVNWKWSILI